MEILLTQYNHQEEAWRSMGRNLIILSQELRKDCSYDITSYVASEDLMGTMLLLVDYFFVKHSSLLL